MGVKFEKTTRGNEILDCGKEFYISFRSGASAMANPILSLPFFAPEKGGDETAIVPRDDRGCRILNGDFREQYAEIIEAGGDFAACEGFFHEMAAEHRSDWSNEEEA